MNPFTKYLANRRSRETALSIAEAARTLGKLSAEQRRSKIIANMNDLRREIGMPPYIERGRA